VRRVLNFIIGLFLANALSVVVADAAILYVDNTRGCPGAGSSSTPYCSIQNALNAVQAGDTIRIRTGTGVYNETASVSGKNGTAANPITVEPDSGASFVIRNTAAGVFTASIKVKESDYWTFRNLTFDAAGVNPSMVALHVQCETRNCTGIVIEGNTFRNWTQTPTAQNGPNVLAVHGCDTGYGCPQNRTIQAVIRNNLFDSNQMYAIKITRTINTMISGNEIKNQGCGKEGGDGAVNWAAIHATYNNDGLIIEDNLIHDFRSYADCPLPLSQWPTVAGYWCDVGGRNTIIRRNKIWNLDQNGADPYDFGKASTGLFIEAGCHSHTVHNNVIYNIKSIAIQSSYHSLDLNQPPNVYYNNTIYNIKGWGLMVKEGVTTFKNNIVSKAGVAAVCYGCTSGNPSLVRLTSDYNLYDDGGSQTKIAEWAGVGTLNFANWRSRCACDGNSRTGNPLFVSTTTPDFNLQSGSPARSAGEGGIDIGAYPYVGISAPVAPSNLQVTINP
jgi:hypothetical protein